MDIDARRAVPEDWDRSGLPAWTYHSEELTRVEQDLLFRRTWQIACHVSDVAEPGQFRTFDMMGERAILIRGQDGELRAFHNLCRHRGSRVLAEESGVCPKLMTCPFHGWSYNLDGTLRLAASPKSLPPLDPVEYGLKPIEMEVWMGFVFLRFLPGDQPAVAEILAHYADEVAAYQTAEMIPVEDAFWAEEMAVNWKAVRDVDNEGYHVRMAHPALQDLYGNSYADEPMRNGSNRSFGAFNKGPGMLWSVRNYKKVLPEREDLPEANRRAWLYIGLFPNIVMAFYPDSSIFYQEFPIAAGRTLQRGSVYRYAEESREMRLARYLSSRIDRDTLDEDTQLIEWTWEAMTSSAFDGIVLSDLEYGVRAYHDALREKLPVVNLAEAPDEGAMASMNAQMLAETKAAAE